jgi:hypothetical protein
MRRHGNRVPEYPLLDGGAPLVAMQRFAFL